MLLILIKKGKKYSYNDGSADRVVVQERSGRVNHQLENRLNEFPVVEILLEVTDLVRVLVVLSIALVLVNAVEEVEWNDEVHNDDHRNHCEEPIQVRRLIAFDREVALHVVR